MLNKKNDEMNCHLSMEGPCTDAKFEMLNAKCKMLNKKIIAISVKALVYEIYECMQAFRLIYLALLIHFRFIT